MRYVQYFNKINGNFHEPCGDRCVVILDGRNTMVNSVNDAIRFNGFRRPTFNAFQIRVGDFLNWKPITKIIEIRR